MDNNLSLPANLNNRNFKTWSPQRHTHIYMNILDIQYVHICFKYKYIKQITNPQLVIGSS